MPADRASGTVVSERSDRERESRSGIAYHASRGSRPGRREGSALGEGRGAFGMADGDGRFSHTFSTTGSESVWPMVTLVWVVVWQRRGYLLGVEGF